ncbi:hypothetical protein G7085_10030 [Tessaracoccus sp. HDW20]|uniref:hypothetical protein n=1 Tax=Tessaracoccus coleopterorum TaxID=2714950 RepID=UPI0018D2E6C3|nr:hypothetical protein [Tessaracoccus coleopterorum]NHB84819.1 hypothetical protein [Tessaracoccus coleopterorum]
MTQPGGYGQPDPQQSPNLGYGEQPPAYGQQPRRTASSPGVRPAASGVRPAASGVRPAASGVRRRRRIRRAGAPQTQTVFILGIVGIFVGIVSFIAWYMGNQAKKEIDAGAPYGWEGTKLKTGYTLGKVFSIIYIVFFALYIAFIIFAIIAGLGAATMG